MKNVQNARARQKTAQNVHFLIQQLQIVNALFLVNTGTPHTSAKVWLLFYLFTTKINLLIIRLLFQMCNLWRWSKFMPNLFWWALRPSNMFLWSLNIWSLTVYWWGMFCSCMCFAMLNLWILFYIMHWMLFHNKKSSSLRWNPSNMLFWLLLWFL